MNEKNLLLIGASGGVGQKLIPHLGNYNVIGHYNSNKPTKPEDLYKADITNYQEVEQMVDKIIKKFDKIDVLVNCAGVSIDSFSHKFDSKTWEKIVDINLLGAFNTIRAVLPHMREVKYGRIINISSVVAQKPVMGTSAYSASKSGLSGLTRTIALENISKGITCNNIALGYFEAGMLYRIPEDKRGELISLIPIKRAGKLEELNNALEFIINTEYYTGQTLNLNGGLF